MTIHEPLFNIPIGVDQTDHIAFFCPYCNQALFVQNVKHMRHRKTDTEPEEISTHIYLKCRKCNRTGKRKFYWITEDGYFCTDRTDGVRRAEYEAMDSECNEDRDEDQS